MKSCAHQKCIDKWNSPPSETLPMPSCKKFRQLISKQVYQAQILPGLACLPYLLLPWPALQSLRTCLVLVCWSALLAWGLLPSPARNHYSVNQGTILHRSANVMVKIASQELIFVSWKTWQSMTPFLKMLRFSLHSLAKVLSTATFLKSEDFVMVDV